MSTEAGYDGRDHFVREYIKKFKVLQPNEFTLHGETIRYKCVPDEGHVGAGEERVYVFECVGFECDGAKKGVHGRGYIGRNGVEGEDWVPCKVCGVAIRPEEAV